MLQFLEQKRRQCCPRSETNNNLCRTTIEQLNNEINALDKRITTIKKQIELPSTEDDIKLQMAEFLKVGSGSLTLNEIQISISSTRLLNKKYQCFSEV